MSLKNNNKGYTSLNPTPNLIPFMYSPIKISIDKNQWIKNKLVLEDEEIPLTTGAMFGGNHYGFIIYNGIKDEELEYPTQCKIVGVRYENGFINVFEEGKFHPWKFEKNGDLVENATFEYYSRRDIEYVKETFEIDGSIESEMAKVNQYKM